MCHFDKLAHKKCAKFQDKKNDTLCVPHINFILVLHYNICYACHLYICYRVFCTVEYTVYSTRLSDMSILTLVYMYF